MDELPDDVRAALEGIDSDMQQFVDTHVRKLTDGKKNMVADSVAIICLMQVSHAIDELKEQVALLGVAKVQPIQHVRGVLACSQTIDNTIMSICKALGAEDQLLQDYCKSVLGKGKGEEE